MIKILLSRKLGELRWTQADLSRATGISFIQPLRGFCQSSSTIVIPSGSIGVDVRSFQRLRDLVEISNHLVVPLKNAQIRRPEIENSDLITVSVDNGLTDTTVINDNAHTMAPGAARILVINDFHVVTAKAAAVSSRHSPVALHIRIRQFKKRINLMLQKHQSPTSSL